MRFFLEMGRGVQCSSRWRVLEPLGTRRVELNLLSSCPPSVPLNPHLIYHYSPCALPAPLLVPHPPLTPTYHTSHLYLAHSCRMEMFENH